MVLEYFCQICLTQYQPSDFIFVTKCCHVFHHKCLHNYLATHNACADCQTPCSQDDILKVFIKSHDSEFANELLKLMNENEATVYELKVKVNEQNPEKNKDDPKEDQLLYKEIAEKNKIIKDLEAQLRDKSLELEKEIRNSTLMIVEKMKLQQQLNETKQAGVESVNQTSTNSVKTAHQNIQQNKNKTQASAGAIKKRTFGNANHLDKDAFDLLKYTKKLQNIGFQFIFHQDNDIYVRQNDFSLITKIENKEQVDQLMRQAINSCPIAEKIEVS